MPYDPVPTNDQDLKTVPVECQKCDTGTFIPAELPAMFPVCPLCRERMTRVRTTDSGVSKDR